MVSRKPRSSSLLVLTIGKIIHFLPQVYSDTSSWVRKSNSIFFSHKQHKYFSQAPQLKISCIFKYISKHLCSSNTTSPLQSLSEMSGMSTPILSGPVQGLGCGEVCTPLLSWELPWQRAATRSCWAALLWGYTWQWDRNKHLGSSRSLKSLNFFAQVMWVIVLGLSLLLQRKSGHIKPYWT